MVALSTPGPSIERPQFRPMAFVLASIIIFGYLMNGFTIFGVAIPGIGLAVTAVVIVFIAAMARREYAALESLLLGVGLSVMTVLIFVYALGQPLPDCPNGFRCTQWFGSF
jgi:hypothetical protein